MDKVSIYGVFEFVGFHLCKRILEKGLEVEGVYFNTENDLFLEEKRLEVGRNANFIEKKLSDMGTKTESEVLIIPLYDWFMTYKKSYRELFTKIVEFIKKSKKTKSRLVYLLPIQLLTDEPKLDGMEELKNFINQTKGTDPCIQYMYLPTIFGPWQPATFLFQRELLNHLKKINGPIEIREWRHDAIYVDDLLNPMIEKIESGESGSFLFDSGIPKSWELCAEILHLTESISVQPNEKISKSDGINKLVLKEVTPYKKAISAQKEHLSMIYNLQDHS